MFLIVKGIYLFTLSNINCKRLKIIAEPVSLDLLISTQILNQFNVRAIMSVRPKEDDFHFWETVPEGKLFVSTP